MSVKAREKKSNKDRRSGEIIYQSVWSSGACHNNTQLDRVDLALFGGLDSIARRCVLSNRLRYVHSWRQEKRGQNFFSLARWQRFFSIVSEKRRFFSLHSLFFSSYPSRTNRSGFAPALTLDLELLFSFVIRPNLRATNKVKVGMLRRRRQNAWMHAQQQQQQQQRL